MTVVLQLVMILQSQFPRQLTEFCIPGNAFLFKLLNCDDYPGDHDLLLRVNYSAIQAVYPDDGDLIQGQPIVCPKEEAV